jgi:type III pantothenate kinase
MLLAIDIGNSTIGCGVFDQTKLVKHWHLATDLSQTQEHGVLLQAALEREKIDPAQITGTIISTVVPKLAAVFAEIIQKQFHRPAVFVHARMDTGLTLSYRNPDELGTDRLVNASVAYDRYRTDLVVVDLGTATTFSVVTRAGEFRGGAIAPGLGSSAETLSARTARLPKVELRPPNSVIATDTLENIRAGVVLGHAAMVDGMIGRIQRELSVSPRVLATGGFAALIGPISKAIEEVSPTLTLDGLAYLYRRASQHSGSH